MTNKTINVAILGALWPFIVPFIYIFAVTINNTPMKTYKVFSLAVLAMSAMFLFCACNKDNADANKISFAKESADITVGPCGYIAEDHHVGGPGYHFDADFTINGVYSHIFLHISAKLKGKKVDLGKAQSEIPYSFEINSSYESGYPYDIHQYCDPSSGGEIGHSSVGTWFKSGTMSLKDDGKTLILDVDGTLQDGRAFKMNITTESKNFE